MKVAVKCGGSDATSGLASNPALGVAADKLMHAGGSIVIGETTEIIGAEHILASRCNSTETSDKLYEAIQRFETEIERMGADMRGGNLSPGNIAGGLSTKEEKSLGCISKCGTHPIQDVIGYAEHIPEHGLYFMDSSGNDIECVSVRAYRSKYNADVSLPDTGYIFTLQNGRHHISVYGNKMAAASRKHKQMPNNMVIF